MPVQVRLLFRPHFMEFVAQLAVRLLVAQVVVGSSPTKLPMGH